MNSLILRIGMATAVSAVSFALPASAQRTANLNADRGWDMRVASAVSTTQISGDAGSAQTVAAPAGMVVTSLQFYEQADKPCRVVVGFGNWALDGDQDVDNADYRTLESGRSACDNDRKTVGPTGRGGAVSGIQICQRRQNDRLKGARVDGARLLPNGVQAVTGSNFDRPNCNEWQAAVDCPTGQVGTGAVVHWGDGIITGIALRCSTVSWQRQPLQRLTNIRGNATPMLTTEGTTAGTGISGTSATPRTLSAPLPNMGLRSITFGERNDRPCYIEAAFWTDNPSETVRTVRFDECNGRHGSEMTVAIPSNINAIQLASTLRICQRQSNDRLKGIHLRGSRIDASGATPDQAINADAERTNCNEWNDLVHCTQGSVISGLIVHFRPSDNRPTEIVGLGMNCSTASRG